MIEGVRRLVECPPCSPLLFSFFPASPSSLFGLPVENLAISPSNRERERKRERDKERERQRERETEREIYIYKEREKDR